MQGFTIFSGETFSPILTFSTDEKGCLYFPDDYEEDEIEERLYFTIKPNYYGCKADTIRIFRRARNMYNSKIK